MQTYEPNLRTSPVNVVLSPVGIASVDRNYAGPVDVYINSRQAFLPHLIIESNAVRLMFSPHALGRKSRGLVLSGGAMVATIASPEKIPRMPDEVNNAIVVDQPVLPIAARRDDNRPGALTTVEQKELRASEAGRRRNAYA